MCQRPSAIHMEDGELHNETGPAMAWEDTKIYSIHGHTVPERVVMNPETITLEDIDKEADAEVKRIMMERYGMERYVVDSGAKIIDSDNGIGVEGSCPRALVEDKHGKRWIIGSDGSTERIYFIPVDAKAKTVSEAHQSISGVLESKIISEG